MTFCRSLVSKPQDNLDQCSTQRFGDAELGCRKRLRSTFDQLFPFGEAFSRREARSIRPVLDGFVGIASPSDRADQLRAKHHDVVARRSRDRNSEQAGNGRSFLLSAFDERLQIVGGKYFARSGAIEGAHDSAEQLRRRRRAGKGVTAVDPDANAVSRNSLSENVGEPVRILQQGFIGRDGTEKLVGNIARAAFVFDNGPTLAALEAHSEHLRKQLADRAHLEARNARRIVVAREQSPKLAIDDDRNGHGCFHAHVLQVFDMNRRHRSQHRQREIKRPAELVELRSDIHWRGVYVGDDPQQAAAIERPRLLRNVTRGIVQALERPDPCFAGFAHHFARAVSIELVDHYAVVAEERADLARAFAIETREIRGLIEPGDHRADGAGGILRRLIAGLGFDDNIGPGDMQGNVEERAFDEFASKKAFNRFLTAQRANAIAKVVNGKRRKELGQWLADHVGRRAPYEIGNVFRHARDDPICRNRDEKTNRLNRAEDVDRFAITIG